MQGISENVKYARLHLGLRQSDLARKVDISENYVTQIENGHKKPSLSLLEKISDTLGVPITSLLSGEPIYEKIKAELQNQ